MVAAPTLLDVAEALAACLCAQLETEERKTCFCGVIPGDMAVASYGTNCKDLNGMAWVRIANVFPSEGLGEQSVTTGNCNKVLGAQFEVGILRQMPKPSSTGRPPSDAELLAASQWAMLDMLSMFKAITCCDALDDKDYILGEWVPAGPLGLMAGGIWTLTV